MSPFSPFSILQIPTSDSYDSRGVRGTFPNPMYDHKNKRPLSPSSKSWLPVEHPDFSPSIHCPPKLLFPEARGRRTRKESKKPQNLGQELENALQKERGQNQNVKKGRRERSLSWSDDEGDVQLEQGRIVPTKLNFDVDLEEKKGAKKQK